MNRKLATSFAVIAATVIVPTASAMAQNRDAEIRYEAAQRRFDGELALFRAEVERYERARIALSQPAAAPAPAPLAAPLPPAAPVVAEAPRAVAEDADVRDLGAPGDNPAVAPRERAEGEDRPPQ